MGWAGRGCGFFFADAVCPFCLWSAAQDHGHHLRMCARGGGPDRPTQPAESKLTWRAGQIERFALQLIDYDLARRLDNSTFGRDIELLIANFLQKEAVESWGRQCVPR